MIEVDSMLFIPTWGHETQCKCIDCRTLLAKGSGWIYVIIGDELWSVETEEPIDCCGKPRHIPAFYNSQLDTIVAAHMISHLYTSQSDFQLKLVWNGQLRKAGEIIH